MQTLDSGLAKSCYDISCDICWDRNCDVDYAMWSDISSDKYSDRILQYLTKHCTALFWCIEVALHKRIKIDQFT